MPTSHTRKEIRQQLLKRRLYRTKWPIVSTFTGAGSATTAIKDTRLSPAALDKDIVKAWIYITSSPVTAGPAIGEVARVTDVDFDNNEVNVAPAFTVIPESGQEYEIHYRGEFHPEMLNELINESLDALESTRLIPLTEITDGDMVSAGTGSWGNTSNVIVQKNATNVRHGDYSLYVQATATPGYVQTNDVFIPEKTGILCSSDVYIPTAGFKARLVLYDVTNSAELDSGTSETLGWSTITFTHNATSSTKRVALRLEAKTTQDIVYFDHAILLKIGDTEFPFPSSSEWHYNTKKVFYYPTGTGINAGVSSNSFRIGEFGPKFWSHFEVERDEDAVVPYRLTVENKVTTKPLWAAVDVTYPNLSADTDTTVAPIEILIDIIYATLLETLGADAHENDDHESGVAYEQRATRLRDKIITLREFRDVDTIIKGAFR